MASGGNETSRPDVGRTTARVICPYGRPDQPVAIIFGAYFKPYEGESESVLMGGTDDITDVSATAFPVRV